MFNRLSGIKTNLRWASRLSHDPLPSRYFNNTEYEDMNSKKEIRIKKVHPNAQMPKYATLGSAGFDFTSVEAVIINPEERVLVKTGLTVEFDADYELQVRPRSGLALKNGVTVLNSPGTIDSDYRGEIGIILINHGKLPFVVGVGDRIAQGIFTTVTKASLVEVKEVEETDRGSGGFGSTGIH